MAAGDICVAVFRSSWRASADDVGPGLIRVDFEYAPTNTRNNSLRNGWVVLDPTRYWQIRQAEVQIDEPREGVHGKAFVENDFDETNCGFPYAARCVLRKNLAAGKLSFAYETVYTTRLDAIDATDTAPFQLATYGVAEPARGVE